MAPGLMFVLMAVGLLVVIGGTGAAIAFGVYVLNRMVRAAQAEAANLAPARAQTVSTSAGAAAVAMESSAVTRRILERGHDDVAPAMGLPNIKMGMWVFLASEVIFFTGLIGAYIYFRSISAITTADTHALNIPLTAVNTFLLLVSSFTVVQALEGIGDGDQTRFRRNLFFTFVLGSVFVSIQGYEWNALYNEGVWFGTTTFGTIFFVLTGFHGMHVISGLLWLLVVIARAFSGHFTAHSNLGVETFGLYWHFVDIVWIILFTIIYLI